MALFSIRKVTVGPRTVTARVELSADAPLTTAEGFDGADRIFELMPSIIEHACVNDQGDTFRACMGDTSLAHLLEHVTIELMVRLGVEDVSAGNTAAVEGEDRVWDITLTCPDDVLTIGALSSAEYLMEWAYSGSESRPEIDVYVDGLKALVQSVSK